MSDIRPVLSVIWDDRADAQQYRGTFLPHKLERGKVDSQNAFDAISELIEISARISCKAVRKSRVTSSVFNSDIERLRQALSRVKGESA